MSRSCKLCGDPLPDDSPAWAKLCRSCFIKSKQEEREATEQSLLKRALDAENKVDIAKRTVLLMQVELRKKEGELRAARGQVGIQKAPVAGASGLDRHTLERMRRLCHPDRHGNSPAANEVTTILNQLLNQ